MGCGQKAWTEDEDDYSADCKYYGVARDPKGSGSKHARTLQAMRQREGALSDKHRKEMAALVAKHRKQASARETVLKKLTPEEISLLGL